MAKYMQDKLTKIAEDLGYDGAAFAAAQEAIRRQDRLSHPDGWFDAAGRFFLAENRGCCECIRQPSRSYPYSEMTHGRSVGHVAALFGATPLHVQRLMKAIRHCEEMGISSSRQLADAMPALRKILKPLGKRST